MKPQKTASIKPTDDGKWIILNTPYSPDLVADLKDAVPWKEREWDGGAKVWKVQPAHLEAVRALVARYATAEGWALDDYTAAPTEAVAAQQEERAAAYMEAHVAAVRAVLPKLPPRALSLVSWKPGDPGTLYLELVAFLDDKPLFAELTAASLAAFRPVIWWPGSKSQMKFTLALADDPRILRALCAYAGLKGRYTSGNVDHLAVHPLRVVTTFADGVVHLAVADADEPTWAGAPYQEVAVDERNFGGRPWDLTLTEAGIYCIWEREALVEDWLGEATHGVFYFGGYFGVAGPDSPSGLERVLRMLHLEPWFHGWANALVAQDTLTKPFFRSRDPGWTIHDWEHPADRLLTYLQVRRRAIRAGLLAILGWEQSDVAAHQVHIAGLKEALVQERRAEDQARAGELAQPKLAAMTKADLLALAERHGVALKKSSGKEEMVNLLAADQGVAEDVIGLTKYLRPAAPATA